VLGSSGMPGDCNKETIYFLLTRPRRRGYFVWTGFAVGAGETLAIISLGVLAAFLMLVYLTGRVYTWRFFGVIPIFGVGTLVVYGQTFLLGILSRSTQDGITYSLGLFLAEVSLPVAVNRFGMCTPPHSSNSWLIPGGCLATGCISPFTEFWVGHLWR